MVFKSVCVVLLFLPSMASAIEQTSLFESGRALGRGGTFVAAYDSDDMKVTLDGTALTAIGKTLEAHETNGESIGFLRFMLEGPDLFRAKLHQMMRTGDGVKAWFLSAIDALAKTGTDVATHSIEGLTWAELDTMEDYDAIKALFGAP